ncbi:hypothetical protein WPG_2305 [Winogradskyella sp. PG-2]|nr:hypothetical protein WPG_2305 [Winogradskyella sp. PG-2]
MIYSSDIAIIKKSSIKLNLQDLYQRLLKRLQKSKGFNIEGF